MGISKIGRPRNVGWVRAVTLPCADWGNCGALVMGLAVDLALASLRLTVLPRLLPHGT